MGSGFNPGLLGGFGFLLWDVLVSSATGPFLHFCSKCQSSKPEPDGTRMEDWLKCLRKKGCPRDPRLLHARFSTPPKTFFLGLHLGERIPQGSTMPSVQAKPLPAVTPGSRSPLSNRTNLSLLGAGLQEGGPHTGFPKAPLCLDSSQLTLWNYLFPYPEIFC